MSTGFASFDEEPIQPTIKPQYPSDQSKKVAPDTYDVELSVGRISERPGNDIFAFTGLIVSDGPFKGWHLAKAIFFDKKTGTPEEKKAYRLKKRDEMLSDLAKLGFDTENWTVAKGRPLSAQLRVACELMKGMRVVMVKKPPFEEGGIANVYINKRLVSEDGMPAKFGAAEMAGAVKPPEKEPFAIDANAVPQKETVPPDEDPLPF